jgi:uncharacterized membrane protein YoaK (UPF0700 family)
MLTARAYSFRQKSRLAISLSWIAGYANVVVFIHSGMMISHVTGNVTHFGQLVSEFKWAAAWFSVYLPLCFLLGAMLSGACVQIATRMHRRSIYIMPMALQAALLAALSIVIALNVHSDVTLSLTELFVVTGLGSAAMGMQNATITSISGAVVRTTHLTGVLTDVGTEVIAFGLWLRDKTRRRGTTRWKRVLRGIRRQPDAQKIALLVSIVASFLFGAVVGTIAYDHAPRVGLVPPVLFLLWIILIDWREPIADLKEIDRLSDPELRSYGLDPSHLPPSLALFRAAPAMAGLKHHAPDFTAWAQDVPRGARVCILSIAHGVHLDANACARLRDAAVALRDADQTLLLAGINFEQFASLEGNDVLSVLSPQNVFPDMEFALARAISLLGPSAG